MPEIQDVFTRFQPIKLSPSQHKAVAAIAACRTETLGTHADRCCDCHHIEFSYNSCRNRHCPKCQGSKQTEWIEAQAERLLPMNYFHIVFTLPDSLKPLVYQNQKLLYSLLMKCAAETLMEAAAHLGNLGAQIGVTVVLHTWGQNLSLHPHVHCIVPGGGLSLDGHRLIRSGKRFLVHVKKLSRTFRGKFLYHLEKAWCSGKLSFFNETQMLADDLHFRNLTSSLRAKEWVVYSKAPFRNPGHVIQYLGRYTHRVAIANSRILEVTDDHVTFRWKDYKDGNRVKTMTLALREFARRFLLHVLPTGFMKIRHYGLFASANAKTKLATCKRLIGMLGSVFLRPMSPRQKACSICGGPTVFLGLCSRSATPGSP